ncbi:hypothetical protein [Actinomadura madurae]|uniref:hypothetical protein n=1 Tax=Actinomadura madurae TaxID=1993 RepID=UPI0020D202BD|nr:hypothetical protein [Actinomadura madurae]MCP9952325.1 hypothetical protein [Actinomadura madurae]MCP9969094.1 hypothetical protein [Actinomadura madurae]MCP9981566.1 hypothetical protein [Actinomadura madurae]MCQ0006926.1 hypothetical protein [Actinomadura madurae]MCQ0017765.1 hypothetical protein [Actinomadura madurae]
MVNPMHGGAPRDDQEAIRLAAALPEHVRNLNHATASTPGLALPSTAYAILGNLGAATFGLDQLLDQLGRFFLRELQAGRLGHDHGQDITEVLSRHGQSLADARRHAQALCAVLTEAQAEINAVHSHPAPSVSGTHAHDEAYDRDRAGASLAATDFPIPITDPTLLAQPPGSGRPSGAQPRRSNCQEA